MVTSQTRYWGSTPSLPAAAPSPRSRRSSLARRLTFAVALVALASLSLFAFITLRLANRDVSSLSKQSEVSFGQAVASDLASSYQQAGSWTTSDVSVIVSLVAQRGLAAKVLDWNGTVVSSVVPPQLHRDIGPTYQFPIDVGSMNVGTLQIRASESGVGIAGGIRNALVSAVGWSALAAALLAILAGLLLARRLTRPIGRLTAAARDVEKGKKGVRVTTSSATDDVAELGRAFNSMAESLERQEQLKSRLVADVAHELRTPVAVLQAWLEAMVDGVVELDKAALSSLLSETLRLSRIVKDLQVLASSDADALALECQPINLSEVASEAAASLETKLAEADLTLVQDLQPVVVLGDKTRLHQVVANLLTNSIKYTPAGGEVTLAVSNRDRKAQITVEDTGIGIPPDELPHIFKRFWRGQGVTRRPGSGIGLAVVAELVHAHGGDVTATSQGRKGTRFIVSLPSQ